MKILKVLIPKGDMPCSCCACSFCRVRWIKNQDNCTYECPFINRNSLQSEYMGEYFVNSRHPDCPLVEVEE